MITRRNRRAAPAITAGLLAASIALAGCGASAADSSRKPAFKVAVINCDKQATFPSPARRIYVNDGNMIAMLLQLGAQDQIAGVAGLERHSDVLSEVYGSDVVKALPIAAAKSPTLENVIAHKPDMMLAGWNYGYRIETNLTPDSLTEHGIAPYILSESCRQADGAGGTMPPWDALLADLANLGKITGHEDRANATLGDIKARLKALTQAPQAAKEPTVFLFDSGTKTVLSSGSFGGPQAIIEAAGAHNALEGVKDTWTSVSWERLVTSAPDFFAFVDYPAQSYADKLKTLRTNPATKNLPAVKEGRFLNLPYSAWTSSPLNIDAAEQLRKSLEEWKLVPRSDIHTKYDFQP